MTLEDLVPPMELCKQIPDGKFEDSACVWCGDQFFEHITVVPRTYSGVQRDEDIAPAPTLQEIMEKLPKHVEYRWYNGKFCPCHPKYDPEDFSDRNPATAALKLWLSVMSEKSDKSEHTIK